MAFARGGGTRRKESEEEEEGFIGSILHNEGSRYRCLLPLPSAQKYL